MAPWPASRARAMARRISVDADAAVAVIRMHRERAEQQRGAARTGCDMPQPDRADEAAALDGDQRQPVRRQAAFAQPLRGLGETHGAIGLVEQGLARCDVRDLFFPNGHH